MRFLELTGLQAALLALITAGIIVALYFLKLRHRRMVVASSMLWGRVLDEMQTQSLWEKLRRLISIIVAVVIGLLIALAVARPEIHWLTGGGERTLLVLDTSPTMLTRTRDGETRWQHAVEAAQRFVNSSAPSSEFRIADTSGRVDAAYTSDRREIREAIQHMRPLPAASRFPERDPEATHVRFITDGVVQATVPRGTARQSVFEAAENVGITAFEIRSTPASPLAYEAYLEIHNYGKESRSATLTIAGAGRQRIERELQLKPNEEFSGPFDLSSFEGGIRATVRTDGDAFPLDDTAYAYLPVDRKTRVLLVTPGSNYLETLLKLDSFVELTTLKPQQYQPGPDFDVYVFDGYTPPNPPPRPTLIVGGVSNVAWLPRATGTIQKPRFGTWAEDHRVMRFVSLHDVSIDAAARIDPEGLLVLAEAQDHSPLIVASPEAQRPQWILLTFNLKGSDFPIHPGFPLFVDNALGWFSREPLALRRQLGVVSVPIPQAQIQALDGTTVPSRQLTNGTAFEAFEPGLYSAAQGDTRQHIAVNLASQDYSNVNKSALQKSGTAAATVGWLEQELWAYMLYGAALLAAVEWFTYHRGITL